MVIRRAQQQDMERINELLMQVCLVHHRGRPDLFQYGQKIYRRTISGNYSGR